ncbi:DHH family phosphoesterase [Desulfonema magnum]|uniref:Phosphoesterasee, DHH-like n=1 Tax=Desulfonema magnum TaxID=45655 RepID=A0A975BVI2_9BACT|nr:DHH family phosphoesterase [Desulfonema magnum]QTA91989.1 Phosphoesterasee, DHH-like [Desulfonema magnum]
MKLSTSEKLRRFYSLFSGNDRVLILINADPDAIASAMAIKRLLWRKVSSVAISNINVIKRPDNIAMTRLLGVNLIYIDEIDEHAFDRIVIVDSQPDHHENFARFQFDVVIDHHPITRVESPFSDIRPEYGATATIMTEYLRAAKIKPSAKLATALFHAIKTDTKNFERQALSEDISAFQFLFRYANIHLARKMEQADLRLDFLKYFQVAFENMRMRRAKAFVHIGTVSNPDVCVLLADFFMRISSVKWSIVSGLYDNKLILIFRNDGLRKHAGKTAKSGFGHMGSAGGHKSMARAEIPITKLKDIVDYRNDKKLLKWIIERVEKKQQEPNINFKKEILGLKL